MIELPDVSEQDLEDLYIRVKLAPYGEYLDEENGVVLSYKDQALILKAILELGNRKFHREIYFK